MHFAEKLNEHKAIGACLEVLQSHMESALSTGVPLKGMVFDEALLIRVANSQEVTFVLTNREIAERLLI